MVKKNKSKDKEQYSTKYLMLELEYEYSDILNHLLELEVENFVEAIIDRDNSNPMELYIFGIIINQKEVYIKLKLRQQPQQVVVCISFHYAERKLNYQFA